MSEARRSRVLVVDDEDVDIAVLTAILRDQYEVSAARDAKGALDAVFGPRPPDLVLLDVRMPGEDGLDLCRRLHADPRTERIPVIFVTALDSPREQAEGFLSGAVDYLAKPVEPHIVQLRVRIHLELRRVREELELQNAVLREATRLRDDVEQIGRHDLKNPLMVALNIPKLVEAQGPVNDQQRFLLRLVEQAARRMVELIDRSVNLHRMERGDYVPSLEPVDLDKVLREVVGDLLPLSTERHVAVVITGQTGVQVLGEEPLVYSLHANLIRNALEASPAGETVSIAVEAQPLHVAIQVLNRGEVPPSFRPRFFEKYATAGKTGGTGLGTYSARLMARTLGGDVELLSGTPLGTVLAVTLPRPPAQEEATIEGGRAAGEPGGTAPPAGRGTTHAGC